MPIGIDVRGRRSAYWSGVLLPGDAIYKRLPLTFNWPLRQLASWSSTVIQASILCGSAPVFACASSELVLTSAPFPQLAIRRLCCGVRARLEATQVVQQRGLLGCRPT